MILMSFQKAQEEYSLNIAEYIWMLSYFRICERFRPTRWKDAPQGWKSWLPEIHLKHLQEQVRACLSFRVAKREGKRMSEKLRTKHLF